MKLYFQIKHDDVHKGKSTMLCVSCMDNIDIWQEQVVRARASQIVVDYIANKVF